MTERMAGVLRIHCIAARPAHVYGIAAGIIVSLIGFDIAAALRGLPVGETTPPLREAEILRLLVRGGDLATLAAIYAWLCVLWATYGGGLTRRLLQQLRGEPPDDLWRATRFCLRPAMLLPSALASACFFLLLAAPAAPWALLPVLPIWLFAGFLYAPLVEREASLAGAFAGARRPRLDIRALARRQSRHLAAFLASTAAVYSAAACWALAVIAAVGTTGGDVGPALIAPAALYALGFTTANLKALQLDLYLESEPER